MANINDIPVTNMANAFPVRRYRKLGSKTSNGESYHSSTLLK